MNMAPCMLSRSAKAWSQQRAAARALKAELKPQERKGDPKCKGSKARERKQKCTQKQKCILDILQLS